MQSAPNWQLKFWRVPQLDNLELLHAAHVTHDYPRHMHEEYSIAVVLRGTETTTCRGGSYKAGPGDLLLINAEEVHANKSEDSEYRLLKVRAKTLQRLALDLGERVLAAPYFPKLVVHDPLLFDRLRSLHCQLEKNGSLLEQESEFIATMGCLLTRINTNAHAVQSGNGGDDVSVRRVRDYLKTHYAENVSLTQLTSLTHLSSFYLLRVFHNHVGFPPHEYQTQVRIGHARKLIRRGASLSQAAVETGFFDQSHLSRNFKRIVGVTPRRYFDGRLAGAN